MKISFFLVALCCCGALHAACPPAPDHTNALRSLVEEARQAPNEAQGRRVSDQMWQFWLDAPDQRAQEVLDEGMSRRQSYDFVGALDAFDRLVEYCPVYAEGYNQRAFIHYLRQDYAAAVVDLTKAISLSPEHVGALSGLALSQMNLGEIDAARDALLQALALNPWLSERHLMAKGAPLAIPGEEL